MSSTRSKNAPGTYACWKDSNNKSQRFQLYEGQSVARCVAHPGLGVLGGQMPSFTMSGNSADIESSLRGLGTCSLEGPCRVVVPRMYCLPQYNVYQRADTILPLPLVKPADPRYTVYGGF